MYLFHHRFVNALALNAFILNVLLFSCLVLDIINQIVSIVYLDHMNYSNQLMKSTRKTWCFPTWQEFYGIPFKTLLFYQFQ